LAVVRSVHHTIRCHNPAIYCSLVGREATEPLAVSNRTNAQRTDHPHYASVLARLRPRADAMPHHVIVPNVVNNGPAKSPGLLAGCLGSAYAPVGRGAAPADPDVRVEAVGLPPDVGRGRLDGRRSLLGRLDREQRRRERAGGLEVMDSFQQRAFDLLTSPR